MTGRHTLDVLEGSDFLTKALNHLGLRSHKLDTKFGVRGNVTKSFVLTRRTSPLEKKRVAAMISSPRQHTSYSSHVVSVGALHRARMS